MPGIVTDSRKYHEPLIEMVGEDMANRLWWEFKSGRQLQWEFAKRRQHQISANNFAAKHRTVDGLGQVGLRIAPELYHLLAKQYGYAAMKDPGFIRELKRDNPGYCFEPTVERKARVTNNWARTGEEKAERLSEEKAERLSEEKAERLKGERLKGELARTEVHAPVVTVVEGGGA